MQNVKRLIWALGILFFFATNIWAFGDAPAPPPDPNPIPGPEPEPVPEPGPEPDSAVKARKAEFRDTILSQSPGGIYPMLILAYEGMNISENTLDKAIRGLREPKADFRLAQLVRVLYLSGTKYDDKLLPALADVDYWLTYGEDVQVYWSENHMILWTSSAYLMKQREGWEMDEYMEQRLNHYLDLKLRYGFYEFFSTDYYRFTLGSLLNLADFAEDPQIRDKATRAVKRMLKEMLMVFNDKGAFYPVAGRNYNNHYTRFTPKSLFWIITGKGPKRTSTDYDGAFLATSSIDLTDVAATYSSKINTSLIQGHHQNENQTVHAGLPRHERTIFQWSAGGYFHPDTANDTAYTVDHFGMQDRKEFKTLASAAWLPDNWFNAISKIGATFSRGSSISRATIDIFKNKNVVLTSLDNFYPGYKGYQQWPWAATIEDIAVWTQTGNIPAGWAKYGGVSQNSHLPKVQQEGNVALITYFPNIEIRIGNANKCVTLHWPTDRFDEDTQSGQWLMARKNDSYIAVYRDGDGYNGDGFPFSDQNAGRQMWAVVVGNKDTHGSYDNFMDVIEKASVKKTYEFDFKKGRKVFFTRIDVDGKYIRNWW